MHEQSSTLQTSLFAGRRDPSPCSSELSRRRGACSSNWVHSTGSSSFSLSPLFSFGYFFCSRRAQALCPHLEGQRLRRWSSPDLLLLRYHITMWPVPPGRTNQPRARLSTLKLAPLCGPAPAAPLPHTPHVRTSGLSWQESNPRSLPIYSKPP